MFKTVLADVDLSAVTGLETCRHVGPSIIDYRTLQRSGPLPLAFLRGVGLPESFIEYLPSLLNQPIQMYNCFISYSSKDQDFAERLHADLQNKGVQLRHASFAINETSVISGSGRITTPTKRHWKGFFAISQWAPQTLSACFKSFRQNPSPSP